jgi:hypothetical protein
MTLRRISPSRVIDMNRWIPGIKYLDSWLSQLERRLSDGIRSGSDRKQLLANKLDEIEELDAYASCSFDFERWTIGRKPNLKVENMYYRSNTLYLLIQ